MAETRREDAADDAAREDSGATDVTKQDTKDGTDRTATGLAAKRKAREAARRGETAEDDTADTDTATDDADATDERDGRRPATDARRGWRRAGVLVPALLGIVGIVAAVVLYQRPGIDYDNQAYVDQEATTEVATAAAAAVQRLMAIDYRTVDEYHDRLGEIVTPNIAAQLDESWEPLKEFYVQSQTVVQVKVTDTAIAFLQDDRAEVLVSTQASVSRDDQHVSDTGGPAIVGLQKVDGVWKLSDIPDLPS